MDPTFLWNALHDGTLVGIAIRGDTTTLEIEVAYLAEGIHPDHDRLYVRLSGDPRVLYRPWGGGWIDDPDEIASLAPEIGSARPHGDALVVSGPDGQIEIVAARTDLLSQTGDRVSLQQLRQIVQDYWVDWGAT